jgi:hypothetical protein
MDILSGEREEQGPQMETEASSLARRDFATRYLRSQMLTWNHLNMD